MKKTPKGGRKIYDILPEHEQQLSDLAVSNGHRSLKPFVEQIIRKICEGKGKEYIEEIHENLEKYES